MKLDDLIKALIDKKVASPCMQSGGARLDRYEEGGKVVAISASRMNKAPDMTEARVYAAYIRRAGYYVSEPSLCEIEAGGINSWIGRKWQIKPKHQPEPMEQGELFA